MNLLWNRKRVNALTGALAVATLATWAFLAFFKKL